MCTVSVIHTPAGPRVVHSRDEQRTRTSGEAPAETSLCGVGVLAPRDPDAGGTWIACRRDGVVFAVMNVNPEPPPPLDPGSLRSRGLLIRDVIGAADPLAEASYADLDAHRCAPFRLIATTPGSGATLACTWRAGGGELEFTRHEGPVCWGTSGLGDSVVAERHDLFAACVGADPTPASQDAFHRHRWPGRGAQSVLMAREDARTVSIITVEPGEGSDGPSMVALTVADGPTPDEAGPLAGPVVARFAGAG